MDQRKILGGLVAFVAAIALIATLFVWQPWDSKSPAADDVETTSTELGDDGTATVGRKTVPLVTSAPSDPSADTTNDPLTPQSIPAGVCPTLEDWGALVNCVEENNLDWYIQGVNARKASTGFDWADIERWAEAKTVNGDTPEVRVIQIFGKGITDKEARSRAAELVGDDVAKTLQIVRQPACFVNTRGLEAEKMQNFVYCPPNSRQVRVSLAPVVLDKDGNVTAILNSDSGIFVDCKNVWWIPKIEIDGECVTKCTPPPSNCPKGTVGTPPNCMVPVCPPGTTGTPPNCETPKCPPGWTGTPPKCLEPKDGTQDGGGLAPTGGGPNSNPGPGTYVPPEEMEQPPSTPYTPPPSPTPAPPSSTSPSSPTPTKDPEPTPSPEPSAPTTDDPATGGGGCAAGLSC